MELEAGQNIPQFVVKILPSWQRLLCPMYLNGICTTFASTFYLLKGEWFLFMLGESVQ